jgi:hypothetical protein
VGEQGPRNWGEPGAVARAIEAGALDDELPAIAAAINARWAEHARLRVERALKHITVGTRVAIGAEAQPKYLRGMTGEVHEIDGEVAVICLGAPVGKFKSGHVRCPAELLVPLET